MNNIQKSPEVCLFQRELPKNTEQNTACSVAPPCRTPYCLRRYVLPSAFCSVLYITCRTAPNQRLSRSTPEHMTTGRCCKPTWCETASRRGYTYTTRCCGNAFLVAGIADAAVAGITKAANSGLHDCTLQDSQRLVLLRAGRSIPASRTSVSMGVRDAAALLTELLLVPHPFFVSFIFLLNPICFIDNMSINY